MADLTPITREEKIIAGEDVKPVTREEKILAGMDIVPVTRREKFLKAFGGGGSGGDEEELKITDARYLFFSGARLDIMDSLIPLAAEAVCFSSMFASCESLTSIPKLDTSNGTDFDNMFSSCSKLTSIPELDTSNGTLFNSMFYNCSSLTTISKLDISNGASFNNMFNYCTALTNLYLYNIRVSIQIGSGASWGHLLTVDSLVHTIKELCTVTNSRTLTIGSANLEKIANLYCKITDDTTEKKPMELCESTDEGAMTLVDYATEKGWQIK